MFNPWNDMTMVPCPSHRLSESPIWRVQREAFGRLGVESWAPERVPFHMTNNSRIASQYADVACAAFPEKPFTVLELGGGSGKFAFLFLGEMKRRKREVRYLLTDAAASNAAFWHAHPLLKDWIESGALQTAVLDPLQEEVPEADLTIASYLFDSIPHDLYRVEKGTLFEGIVSFPGEGTMQVAYRPLQEKPDPILEEYRARFESGTFLIPTGALEVIRRMAKQDFFILAADSGVWKEEEVASMPTALRSHGSAFSFPVNFHAIGRYVEREGGKALFSKTPLTVAFLSNRPIPHAVFDAQIFGPLNIEAEGETEMIERLEEANWDATLFFSYFDRIPPKLIEGMRRIGERFFPLFREETVLLERLGLYLESLGEKEEAERLFVIAARCRSLPAQKLKLDFPLSGDVLQVGGDPEWIQGRVTYISWGVSLEKLGKFDAIFLFPPQVVTSQKKKPSVFKEIEERFSLDTISYSDKDIEEFFSLWDQKADPKEVLAFFIELARKKNISSDQLERVAKRLGQEAPIEDDRFFETLRECSTLHMKPGSTLRAFLPNIASYDDPRYFEEILVNPFFECTEKEDPRGLWLTVKKLETD